jgi:glycosyltransferase involved in cell wall biosynthesis
MAASSRPLRVLELRTVRGTGGGPEKTILLGTARTDRSRYEVTVCYIRDERDSIFQVDKRADGLPVDYVEIRERHSLDRSIWPSLRALVRKRRIDLVHAHDYKTDLLAWMLGKREGVIPMATAHGWTGHSSRERLVYYPADRWILARLPYVVAVSSDVRHTLLRAGARSDRVGVVLNGIDPVVFRRDPGRVNDARARWSVGPADVVIGAVGRLEPQKRFDLLITAFARIALAHPRATLLIAGDGSQRDSLTGQIAACGLERRCRLLGHVEDIRMLHHAFNVFAQSSTYEGTPNAVLEAMALETSIVATEAGGTAELARHDIEAIIVPAEDEAALAAGLDRALRDCSATAARTRAARARVEGELSFETRMKRVERVYDQLQAGRGEGRPQ